VPVVLADKGLGGPDGARAQFAVEQLLEIKEPEEQVDLKLATVRTVEQAMLEALQKQ
jgi:hypothetical protein